MRNEITRAAEIDRYKGRTLEGIAYRYDKPSRVTDDGWVTSYYEEILRGADKKTLSEHDTFPLHVQHDKGSSYGSVTFHHSEDERALLFRATVEPGEDGDAILKHIDKLSDVSVSYEPIRSKTRRLAAGYDVTQRAEIRLGALSLAEVGTGQHQGAEVLALRAATTPKLDKLRRRLILL